MKDILIFIIILSINFGAEAKIGGVTFFDFVSIDDSTAFNFQRQYFSYGIDMSKEMKFNVIFDVGRSIPDEKLNAYLKKAQIDYQTSYGNLSLGLIGMNTYGIQEKNWGYRFIEKSAIDRNKFSSTVDLGVSFSKLLIDKFILNLQITNGEGFKKAQLDKFHKYSFNLTYGEQELNKNDGYNIGIIYSTEPSEGDPSNMISLFGGFSGMGLRIGSEYDMLTLGDIKKDIISITANYKILEYLDTFVRYDIFDDNLNEEQHGNNYLIMGVFLNCKNGFSLSPNVRLQSFENSDKASKNEYKLNFMFKF